jgi:hypothetical protein
MARARSAYHALENHGVLPARPMGFRIGPLYSRLLELSSFLEGAHPECGPLDLPYSAASQLDSNVS